MENHVNGSHAYTHTHIQEEERETLKAPRKGGQKPIPFLLLFIRL